MVLPTIQADRYATIRVAKVRPEDRLNSWLRTIFGMARYHFACCEAHLQFSSRASITRCNAWMIIEQLRSHEHLIAAGIANQLIAVF